MEMENRNENSCTVVSNHMNHGHVYKNSHHIYSTHLKQIISIVQFTRRPSFPIAAKANGFLEKSLF